jgi:hypothetical protein
MDAVEVLRLILLFPSDKAEAFKLWIAELAAENEPVEECVEEAITEVKDVVRWRVGRFMQIVRRKEFDVLGDWEVDADESMLLLKAA